MTEPASFYLPDSDPTRFVATELTRGPWSELHQHGGPPAALLADAIAQADGDAEDWLMARVTVELLRPIPIAPVRVTCEAVRRGRRAQWWAASLRGDDDRVLARATATRIRRAPVNLPAPRHPPAPALRTPVDSEPFVFPFFRTALGYHTAVEVRIAAGTWGPGPAAAWIRSRVPLVLGRPMSGIARLVVAADAANGVAYVLDVPRYAFVNPDLAVTSSRPHTGEWVGMDTQAVADPGGAGCVEARLYDHAGPVGRSVQTLVVYEV